MPPMAEDLKSQVSAYISSWRGMSRLYAWISVLLRGSLIVTSALVAAKLGSGKLLSSCTAAVLSVYVAAGTGLEAWCKPREKWKGFMTDCENAEDLLMRLQNAAIPDPKQADEYRLEFQRILMTHREKNVF
jgi:hypothetical protein